MYLHCKFKMIIPCLFLILLYVMTPKLSAQTNSDTTTIVIIGTVHNSTKNFTDKTLYNILDHVKPEVILNELDSSFFTANMIMEKYANISLENKTVTDYAKIKDVQLRPYDIEGRNQIYEKNNYFNLQKQFSAALSKANENNLLNAEAKGILQAVDSFGKISFAFSKEKPDVINSFSCDVSMELKHQYDSEGLQRVAELTPSLKEFETFCKFRSDFWVLRNNTMADNIIKWCNVFNGKTIVVLCGFEHRYYLINSLNNKIKDSKFKIREYQTY